MKRINKKEITKTIVYTEEQLFEEIKKLIATDKREEIKSLLEETKIPIERFSGRFPSENTNDLYSQKDIKKYLKSQVKFTSFVGLFPYLIIFIFATTLTIANIFDYKSYFSATSFMALFSLAMIVEKSIKLVKMKKMLKDIKKMNFIEKD